MKKIFIDANSLLIDSFKLAALVWKDNYRPTVMVIIGRGGAPIGIALHEFFWYQGWEASLATIKSGAYVGLERKGKGRIEGVSELVSHLSPDDRLLLVDDVFDTGMTIQQIIGLIKKMGGDKVPAEIRIATLYYKPHRSQAGLKPHYYLKEVDSWLVFPHELCGLTLKEIKEKGEAIRRIVKDNTPGRETPSLS